MKYAVLTFGCRVNQADSQAIEQSFRERGATVAAPDCADVVVVNTCSVTATADQGARQAIRRIARCNPRAEILVTGCYASRDPDAIRKLPNVERIVPNDSKLDLARFPRGRDELTTAERFGAGDGSCGAPFEPGLAGRTAITLRVQTGCAEACSYCIIPKTRGKPQSVPVSEVLRHVERASTAGYREVILTGVHLGSYGRDLAPRATFLDLLRALARRDFGARLLIRVSSLEPMECPADLVDLVADAECFAPHFHLPLQHASDAVLAKMGRPYTLERYAALVDHIRARMPAASIGTDIIVGFPGERVEDFEVLARYLPACPLTHLHVFPYSDRPGTAASRMAGRVPGALVRERARRVREIGSRLSDRFQVSQVGAVRRALTIDDGSRVVTDNYLRLHISPGFARNQWVDVQIAGRDRGIVVNRGSEPAN